MPTTSSCCSGPGAAYGRLRRERGAGTLVPAAGTADVPAAASPAGLRRSAGPAGLEEAASAKAGSGSGCSRRSGCRRWSRRRPAGSCSTSRRSRASPTGGATWRGQRHGSSCGCPTPSPMPAAGIRPPVAPPIRAKPDLGGCEVRMRLAFVLSRPLTEGQLEAWLGGIPGLDPATFRTAQEIYVGRPIFTGGLVDPMPVRSGVLDGLEDFVQVPDGLPAAQANGPGPWLVLTVANDDGDGLGLVDSDALEAVLAQITGNAGDVRAWPWQGGAGLHRRSRTRRCRQDRACGTAGQGSAQAPQRSRRGGIQSRGSGRMASRSCPPEGIAGSDWTATLSFGHTSWMRPMPRRGSRTRSGPGCVVPKRAAGAAPRRHRRRSGPGQDQPHLAGLGRGGRGQDGAFLRADAPARRRGGREGPHVSGSRPS